MTDQQLNELKEFFDQRLEQRLNEALTEHGAQLEARIDARLGARIDALEAKVDNGFQGVAEAIDAVVAQLEQYQKITNRRLARLERNVFGY